MSQSLPLVSVVVVSWNAKAYLSDCMASLFNNVYAGSLEVIVVDNASEDGSAELISQHYPAVTLIANTDNLGFAKASNIGIQRSSGEYIALVNSDVRVMTDCISILVEFCQAHPAAGLVGPFIIGPDGNQQMSYRAAPSLWNEFCRALALEALFPRSALFNGAIPDSSGSGSNIAVDVLSGCFWLTPRRAIDDVGMLDESFFIYGEDMDWCKRFKEADWDVSFVPDAKAIHYGGASSANAPIRFSVEMQKAITHYWRKHHSGLALLGYYINAFFYHSLRVAGHSLRGLVAGKNGQQSWFKVKRSLACLRWLISGREPVQ